MQYLGIHIDQSRDALFSDFATSLLKKYYLKVGEGLQQGFARASVAYCGGDLGLAQRIYDAASQQWFAFASPILSNASVDGNKDRALPASCFLSYVPDTVAGLIDHTVEFRWMSVLGGGVGGHWDKVRSMSDQTPGPIPFLVSMNADTLSYRQGRVRRGSYAAYMDVSNPEIVEFIGLRTPTGGDINRKAQNLHHAVNLPDAFMEAVQAGDWWQLRDPHSGEVVETVKARHIWQRILETRSLTGEPFLSFIDTANRDLPQSLKDKGQRLHGSNLCTEIWIPTSKDQSAVCVLSSLNLKHYDDWIDKGLVADLVTFLDNVVDVFIDDCPDVLHKAKKGMAGNRAIGIGYMGFHDYLQDRELPFDCAMSLAVGENTAKEIHRQGIAQTVKLGEERGVYPDGNQDETQRNSLVFAVAPNSNSSIIAGVSPSVEPRFANIFEQKTRNGVVYPKNPALEAFLEAHNENTDEVWADINRNRGSVQHLDWLTDEEREVFKTAMEIDQRWIIEHAAARQPYICQGQSINLFFPGKSDRAYVRRVHELAWERGLKALYYFKTESAASADKIGNAVDTTIRAVSDLEGCVSCEG